MSIDIYKNRHDGQICVTNHSTYLESIHPGDFFVLLYENSDWSIVINSRGEIGRIWFEVSQDEECVKL